MGDAHYAHYGDLLSSGPWMVMFISPRRPGSSSFDALVLVGSPATREGTIAQFTYGEWDRVNE